MASLRSEGVALKPGLSRRTVSMASCNVRRKSCRSAALRNMFLIHPDSSCWLALAAFLARLKSPASNLTGTIFLLPSPLGSFGLPGFRFMFLMCGVAFAIMVLHKYSSRQNCCNTALWSKERLCERDGGRTLGRGNQTAFREYQNSAFDLARANTLKSYGLPVLPGPVRDAPP